MSFTSAHNDHLDPDKHAPEQAPENILRSVGIYARLLDNGTWIVRCPEWRCEIPTKNLTKTVAMLCAEIENHNEDVSGNGPPRPDKDFNAWAEANGMPRLTQEHHPNKRKPIYGDDAPAKQDYRIGGSR